MIDNTTSELLIGILSTQMANETLSNFTNQKFQTYENEIYGTKDAIEIVWSLVATAMIFFMQSGFALVEVGSVRLKNAQSILIKNLCDSAIGCIGFWLVGYAFAFGNVHYFIGFDPKYFASSGFSEMETDNYKWWIFQYSFAATSATIVSGALAERCQLATYLCFSFLMTSFIYPVVVSWIWAEKSWGNGWLKQLGFIDFAGSGVVHMVGGVCAVWGAKILGERYGKEKLRRVQQQIKEGNLEDVDHYVGSAGRNSIHWEDHEFQQVLKHVKGDYQEAFKEWISVQQPEFRAHNPALIVTGTLLLWVCWLFFNGGSAAMFSERRNAPAKVIMCNVISAAAGGLFAVFFKPRICRTYSFVSQYDPGTICNGIIVGLVSCTASCDKIEVWSAFLIGTIGSTFYSVGCLLLQKFNIDDPLEASAVHLGGGTWGVLAVAFFNNEVGLFYNGTLGIKQLGFQLLGAASIALWVTAITLPFFLLMKRLDLLRVPKEIEVVGLDISELGGVSEEVYSKLRKDFNFLTPNASAVQSFRAKRSMLNDDARNSLNRNDNETGSDEGPTMVYSKKLGAGHEVGRFKYE